ncbi:MAG: Oxidoreductase [Cirrosporium novae-zelandiae]|nr:MAG: Oxidoreductase [Cirrosporium novae-zelandiae]
MFRPITGSTRLALRQSFSSQFSRTVRPPRRLLSTAPKRTSRNWKNTSLRWGLAAGIVYWYNTTSLFAEQPYYNDQSLFLNEPQPLPTVESISQERRERAQRQELAEKRTEKSVEIPTTTDGQEPTPDDDSVSAAGQSPEELEEEAGQQGAFNEETGEINWDCPCLGGMAHGPCGEEFRAAFSCFVYSKDEPKGMDCIEHFKGMQDCFRQHPDVYGEELAEDGDEEGGMDVPANGEAPPSDEKEPIQTPSQPSQNSTKIDTTEKVKAVAKKGKKVNPSEDESN